MVRYLTAGESHGKALVGIVEGLPAGIEIDASYINHQLHRRQQGFGRGARMRIESDSVEILSGVRFGKTIGSPVSLLMRNADHDRWRDLMSVDKPIGDFERVVVPRGGHADYAGAVKYGFDDIRNVIERASARETAIRVACGTVVRKFLEDVGIFAGSHVLSIGEAATRERSVVDKKIARHLTAACGAYKATEEADTSNVRMLDDRVSALANKEIRRAMKSGNTLGGVFEVIVTGLPVGLGSYVQHDRRLDAALSAALMSIQGIKGVEIGSAFHAATRSGREVNDAFRVSKRKGVERPTNNAGGLEGGVTNGEPLVLHAAMKPLSSLAKPLPSVNLASGRPARGRYERSDVCAVPAASVVGEAVIMPVVATAFLEKFGGDSMTEILSTYSKDTCSRIAKTPKKRRNP